jgi:hypothetical protein
VSITVAGDGPEGAPIRPDALVESMSFRNRTARPLLRAATALAAAGGTQLVFDDGTDRIAIVTSDRPTRNTGRDLALGIKPDTPRTGRRVLGVHGQVQELVAVERPLILTDNDSIEPAVRIDDPCQQRSAAGRFVVGNRRE